MGMTSDDAYFFPLYYYFNTLYFWLGIQSNPYAIHTTFFCCSWALPQGLVARKPLAALERPSHSALLPWSFRLSCHLPLGLLLQSCKLSIPALETKEATPSEIYGVPKFHPRHSYLHSQKRMWRLMASAVFLHRWWGWDETLGPKFAHPFSIPKSSVSVVVDLTLNRAGISSNTCVNSVSLSSARLYSTKHWSRCLVLDVLMLCLQLKGGFNSQMPWSLEFGVWRSKLKEDH